MIGPMICIAGVVVSVVGSIHCWLVYRNAVRMVWVDHERVRRFVQSAPLHLLEEQKVQSPVCQCCGAPFGSHGE